MAKLTNDMVRAAQESGAIKPGEYSAVLKAVTLKTAKESGNEMWRWEFEIDEGVHAGRKLFDNAVLTDAAAWKLLEIFRAFGEKPSTDTDELLGRTVTVKVANEDYDGRTMNRIEGYVIP